LRVATLGFIDRAGDVFGADGLNGVFDGDGDDIGKGGSAEERGDHEGEDEMKIPPLCFFSDQIR